MTGYDEFVNLFGDITVLNVLQVILAVVFLYFVYKKVRDYLIKRYEDDKKKDAQLKEALDAISKYPQYRQQSIEIQQKLESEIQGLRLAQEENNERLRKMEDAQMKLERNKLRDRLLQSYRFYTDKAKNPTLSWSRMEAEAFWELFGEYEERGGDGFVHTEVQPAMNRLTVVEVDEQSV